jgi:predicted nucleic acid-binding protein
VSGWFLDASVLLASEDPDDREHAAARQLLRGDEMLATLDLCYYEVANVAVRSWRDLASARRLSFRVAAIGDEGGMVCVGHGLMADATSIAHDHDISVYDAAYVSGAHAVGAQLVSCDVRDLVSKGLALPPSVAVG